MSIRAILLVLPLALVAGACGGKQGPLLSHGKPVSHWIEQLGSPDPKARLKAVKALGHAGQADPAAIGAVAGALKDRDAGVRGQAALALLQLGPAAAEAVPALTEACQDRDAQVRSCASRALERIQGGK
jgi:HEAT repeat protein